MDYLMSCTQLELFPDIEFEPTPAMVDGRSHLFACRQCGTLICVPSSSKRSTLIRQVKRELGNCPRCHTADFYTVDLGEGPFKPKR